MSALRVSFLLNCWYHFPSQCPLCVLYLFSALSCRVATLQISLIIVSQLAPVLNWEITDFIKSKSFELWHKLSHQNCHPGLLCGAFCGLWSSFNTCNQQMFFRLTASTTTQTKVSISPEVTVSLRYMHAWLVFLQNCNRPENNNRRIAQTRDFWNVDHVAAVQLWDGGHYSSSSLTPSLLSKHKRDMSGSKNMWNLKSWNFYNEEAGFASKNAQDWKYICQPRICFPSLCRSLCAIWRLENVWVGAVRGLKMGSTIIRGMTVTYQPDFCKALISGGSLNPPKAWIWTLNCC